MKETRRVDTPAPVEFGPPLQPRRAWFVGLLVVFAAWVVFLIVLYFKTVR